MHLIQFNQLLSSDEPAEQAAQQVKQANCIETKLS